ncbi:uncharacterized protein A4U43_C07F39210 [Asparagus officinalis]|uniref:Bulb-type lectin domain-containing protein n=1 Tax=Asparagus officinalis TaxID=4686 RepID=A0A5P1EID7_ASPOF|nr:uncharacterized protein A4U43_C07F39210 [Asparagus officinalis]
MEAGNARSFLQVTVLLLILSSPTATARDTITPGEPPCAARDLSLWPAELRVGFFNPPNSNNSYVGLWYNKISQVTVLWVGQPPKSPRQLHRPSYPSPTTEGSPSLPQTPPRSSGRVKLYRQADSSGSKTTQRTETWS